MEIVMTPEIKEAAVGPTPPYIDLERNAHPTKMLGPTPPFIDIERSLHPTKMLAPTPVFEDAYAKAKGFFTGTALPFVLSTTFLVGLLAGYVLHKPAKERLVDPVVATVKGL
jgi:hypothetical protein